MQDGLQGSYDHFRNNMSSRAVPNQQSPSPSSRNNPRAMTSPRQHAQRSVIFTPTPQVHSYPPEVWGDDEEVYDDNDDDGWNNVGGYDVEDPSLAEEAALAEQERCEDVDPGDEMSWEEMLPDPSRARDPAEEQRRQQEHRAQQLQQQLQQQQEAEQQVAQHYQQQQRQQIEGQRSQQEITAQTTARQASATSTQRLGRLSIRHQGSRDQLILPQDSSSVSLTSSASARFMDLINSSETKKMSLTPLLLQDNNQRSQPPRQAPPRSTAPTLPSGVMFFDRRKDTHKEKGTNDSIDINWPIEARSSEEYGPSSNHTGNSRGPQTPPRRGLALTNTSPPVSQHTSSFRQRDGDQQGLYPQQYPTRSPVSPPEWQPLLQISPVNLGQRSIAPTLSLTSEGRRSRPGLLLIRGNINGDGSSLVPDLSVIRVFAGKELQTEETSRTVLLNSSTSSEELVKRAIQRFLLPAGEDATDYYLTVKRLEGSSTVLRPEEKPLVVFETLAGAALDLPKVKRSSVGNISSTAIDVSQGPAIKKLPMNDFTDDAPVKIYLNRRPELASDEGGTMEEGDTTSNQSVPRDGEAGGFRPLPLPPPQGAHHLSTVGVSVPSERFSGPSSHIALHLLIYPNDLPDDMVFDPLTDSEAIVFKNTLRSRTQAAMSSAPFRRKSFVFPNNVTVAEVIEIGLERFGIPGGVVDGSDEVEDKNTKRRSSSGVRYVLNVLVDGKGGWRPLFRSYFILTSI